MGASQGQIGRDKDVILWNEPVKYPKIDTQEVNDVDESCRVLGVLEWIDRPPRADRAQSILRLLTSTRRLNDGRMHSM